MWNYSVSISKIKSVGISLRHSSYITDDYFFKKTICEFASLIKEFRDLSSEVMVPLLSKFYHIEKGSSKCDIKCGHKRVQKS